MMTKGLHSPQVASQDEYTPNPRTRAIRRTHQGSLVSADHVLVELVGDVEVSEAGDDLALAEHDEAEREAGGE